MRAYITNIFSLDLRSLALFRIGLGLVSLYNLVDIFPHLDYFFGPLGFYGLDVIGPPSYWSIHALSDRMDFVQALFILHMVFSVMLLVGYKTRLATIVCWAMTLSLFNRVPAMAFGGDEVLRAALLWGMFLPLGRRFSVDERFDRSGTDVNDAYFSVATTGLICQLIIIYLINGFGKTDPAWSDYTALLYVLHYTLAKPWGAQFLAHPGLLIFFAWLTIYLECYGTLLLLMPSTVFFRSILIVAFVIFHVLIDYALKVGWFSGIMCVFWSVLIPSAWWKHLSFIKNRDDRAASIISPAWNQAPASVLLVLVSLCAFLYLQPTNIRTAWEQTTFYQMIRQAGIPQNILKFNPLPKAQYVYEFIPVFDSNVHVDPALLKRYSFDNHPPYRAMRFVVRGPHVSERLVRVKKYLTARWNAQYPQGPEVKDVDIYLNKTQILPFSRELERPTRIKF